MPGEHNFEHLPLLLRRQGRARLKGGGKSSPQTRANKNAREAHSASLTRSAHSLTTNWRQRKEQSQEERLPVIPQGIPILLQVDPILDLDVLRDKFAFEIVAEQEEGYVIVAAQDIELTPFLEMVNGFSVAPEDRIEFLPMVVDDWEGWEGILYQATNLLKQL